MKKLLMFAAFAFVLCSCGSGNGKKKFDEEIVKEDRKEYKDYIRKARQYEDNGNLDAAIKQYEYALEIESTYSDTEYSEWFNSDVAGTLESLTNPVVSLTGTHMGYEWVDLGLSVKWATCNVGALSPGAYGNYYAWGETSTKGDYSWSTYEWYDNSTHTITKYNADDKKKKLDASDDAARANWSGDWRLPTKKEFQELRENCTWERTTHNGHNGYKVTSKKNGQSIFLPAAGWRYGADELEVGSGGFYWGSTPIESDTYVRTYGGLFVGAYGLYFDMEGRNLGWNDRYSGRSVRPVLE